MSTPTPRSQHPSPDSNPSASGASGSAPSASGTPGSVALSIRDLHKSYTGKSDVAALRGVTFDAKAGQITAILGPNGAGKTSLLEICEGLRTATHGQVRVLGLDPAKQGAQLRPRIGVMLQDGGLPGTATVGAILKLGHALHENPLSLPALRAALELDPIWDRRIRRLSGGERQRVSLALALMGQPELLFLDEPTAGMDPAMRRRIWELISSFRSAGCTIILTTHLIHEAEAIADHVVLIASGTVAAAGTVEQLTVGSDTMLTFTAPDTLDLNSLTDALPLGISVRRPDLPPHTEPLAGPHRRTFQVLGSTDSPITPIVLATLTAWCAERGIMPDAISTGRQSLEDIVLQLADWTSEEKS